MFGCRDAESVLLTLYGAGELSLILHDSDMILHDQARHASGAFACSTLFNFA